MKAKLIKTDKGNYILIDPTKGVYDKGYQLGNSIECDVPKLSTKNCDDIFGVVDVEKLADSIFEKESSNMLHPQHQMRNTFILGFNKAMELSKDKVFTEDDMRKAYNHGMNNIDGNGCVIDDHDKDFLGTINKIQQPTEIEVTFNPEEKDSDGCLILKRF